MRVLIGAALIFAVLLSPLPGRAMEAPDWTAALAAAQQKLAAADYATARPLFEQQAVQGNGLAQFTLGLFFQLGWGVAPSAQQSCYWFKQAALQQVPAAQYQLGLCYLADHFNSGEQQLAYIWLERAYQAGLLGALCEMGKMHVAGIHAASDKTKGVQMCLAAADAGVLAAQLQLADWLLQGDVIAQDAHQALHWLSLAAEKGDAKAAFDIGRLYDSGTALPQDSVQALYWYEIAASRGFAAAYLPSAALRWLHYQRSDEAQAPSHLAKAYIWAKVLQQSATAATPADNAAELLMQQILAVMPAQWQQTLNKKVTDHVRHNTVLQQTPG